MLIFLGFLVGVYALFERYALHQGNRAFLYLVLLLVLAGLILFGLGFVGEMLAGMREEVRGLQREMDQFGSAHSTIRRPLQWAAGAPNRAGSRARCRDPATAARWPAS